MSVRRSTFTGANVFLSRNLVAPEVFDAIHDALRLNGAQVFLCCDPSRTSPNDYHVISSPDHEKFEDLRAKGCNLVGPNCIFSCAKEHRMLPKHGYTSWLTMDGVKVLASGFDKDEKAKIEKLITVMGGVLQTKTSMDINFVVVKNVLAAKYKWALHVLKKPIVNMQWVYQCWTEHRVVPQEPYRVLPFVGLTICVTKIPADERKEIERLVIDNGGLYSADLTKKCSHLVSNAPNGDKYIVAQRWGHIHIVSRKWIDQSILKRACLDERLYPVLEASAIIDDSKNVQKEPSFIDPSNVTSQSFTPFNIENQETASSQNIFISEASVGKNEISEGQFGKMKYDDVETNVEKLEGITDFDCPVARDSEDDDNDLYLSGCRIFLVGFEEKEMRRLVNLIRRGGGTRHMLLSERLTHIVLGTPSEAEKKEVRRLGAWGVVNSVNATWLEESDRAKRELSVSSRHIFSTLTHFKDSTQSSTEPYLADHGVKKAENIRAASPMVHDNKPPSKLLSDEKQVNNETSLMVNGFLEANSNLKGSQIDEGKLHSNSFMAASSSSKETFKGKYFCFSSSFPLEPRTEVIEWVKGGGGIILDDLAKGADFTIECHGRSNVLSAEIILKSISVTTHWIRSSLEECCMLDVASHILFSPLRCLIPLPGFEGIRFCVSQYEGKERMLLRNLCFVLGAKFTEKLTKKVSHLLCKFTNGPKYEAACRKGIHTITADWISECISQDKLVPLESFRPRPVTMQDREAGLCTVSQYSTQADQMISFPSQWPNQPKMPIKISKLDSEIFGSSRRQEDSDVDRKRLKLSEQDVNSDSSKRVKITEVCSENCKIAPDVAEAIEDLLAQSGKFKDQKLPGISGTEKSIYAPDHAAIGQNHGISKVSTEILSLLPNRSQEQDTSRPAKKARKSGPYDAFSETQTESQVVVYEEDLSGRQKIIERVKSQNFTLSPDVRMT